MNVLDLIIVGVTIGWSLFCMWVLAKKLKELQENTPSKKKLYKYTIIMIVFHIIIIIVFKRIYIELSLFHLLKRIAILGILWMIAPIDYKFYKIPNNILIIGIIARGVLLVGELLFEREFLGEKLLSSGIGMVIIVIVTFLCSVLIKGSIGAGDIKLMIVMAMFQEATGVFTALFISMIVSFFIAIVLIIMRKKTKKDTMPFGPSVLIGTYLAIFLTGA